MNYTGMHCFAYSMPNFKSSEKWSVVKKFYKQAKSKLTNL